jgi:hypothetical protein
MREGSRAKDATSRTLSRRSTERRSARRATQERRPSWRRTRDTRCAPRVTDHPSRMRPRGRRRAGPVTRRKSRARPRAISVVRSATTRTRVSPRPRAPRATRARRPESTRLWSAAAQLAIVRMVPRGSPRPHRARAVTRLRPCRLFMPSPATRFAAAVTWRPTSHPAQTASPARGRATRTNATIRRALKYARGATSSGAPLRIS